MQVACDRMCSILEPSAIGAPNTDEVTVRGVLLVALGSQHFNFSPIQLHLQSCWIYEKDMFPLQLKIVPILSHERSSPQHRVPRCWVGATDGVEPEPLECGSRGCIVYNVIDGSIGCNLPIAEIQVDVYVEMHTLCVEVEVEVE